MPLTHLEKFKVRYTECDRYGHVNNANYLRYMQEAAFGASAAAGYDFAKYDELGQYWLVRETDVEYLKPLRYHDEFEIKTWVQDFRRVRSRRLYEFRLSGSDDLIARASTDWVYLDLKANRPVSIPPEMIVAFYPEGVPDQAPPRDPFPAAPPPPPGVFKLRRRVTFNEIDMAQHVNNAVYLSYVEDAAMQVTAHYGWPIDQMYIQNQAILVRRQRIEYLQPALMQDEIEIVTWVSAVKRVSATRHFIISRAIDGEVLARVHTGVVWVDLITGQPQRFPEKFLADLAPNLAH
jgi:acyl-CoA thioester hydrolase